ncbi:MAG TPA: RtcB family protein [Spirochaetota bacterium]|nr:RtcB family protein [Spirochaetota bacterium]
MKTDMLHPVSPGLYEIPADYKKGMRVPARIYADWSMLDDMDNAVLEQLTNVAMLPGIQKYALCMPDGHSGYGFPIGGVAAIDPDEGVISPGGIGFDINCGIRLVATNLTYEEIKPSLTKIVDRLFAAVPSGVGGKGMISLSRSEFDTAVREGTAWAVKKGFGVPADMEYTEDSGTIAGADPSHVSMKAFERGKNQIGTLGSGNHFLEIQVVKKENIYDESRAREFGIVRDNQVFLMIHCGSRGYGHQIASDYLQRFLSVMQGKYGLSMPDRELACAPFRSDDGSAYFGAMNCAINFAFINRQLIMHRVREVFGEVLRKSPEDLGMRLVYDVCHNTAKLETHSIDGRDRELLIHRKGATRAFPGNMKGVPGRYRGAGQPVIIGGSMETGSYLLAGEESAADSFFSTAHGSGRAMSRKQAKKQFNGRELLRSMKEKGIYVQTASLAGLAEEAGSAYKNIDEVVRAAECAGISRVVAKFIPVGNIKG